MSPRKPAFVMFGVPVYLPFSSLVGLALVAWFAIPTAAEVAIGSDLLVWLVALIHGLVVYLAVFAHELGHVLVGRRLGYQSSGVVVHIWGGHATFAGRFAKPKDQFLVAVAGPAATALCGFIGLGMVYFDQPMVDSIGGWLAWSSFLIAVVNLLPGVPLDGGAALAAVVWSISKNRNRGDLVAGIGGLLVSAFWLASPWLFALRSGREPDTADLVLSFLVGSYLAANAWAVIANARKPEIKPDLVLGEAQGISQSVEQLARRCSLVELGTSVEVALSAANAAQAGAIVVVKNGLPIGLVRNAAIAAVPADQRTTLTVEHTARRISDDDLIPVDTQFADLAKWSTNIAADEWLVIDSTGQPYGVLVRTDLNQIEEVNG